MRLLLDTQPYLWWLADDPELSREARAAIEDAGSIVHVSAASIWEASLKQALGRVGTDADLVEEIAANGFEELPVTSRHAAEAAALQPHHDDMFDRILVAQAGAERLTLVTRDQNLAVYEIDLLLT